MTLAPLRRAVPLAGSPAQPSAQPAQGAAIMGVVGTLDQRPAAGPQVVTLAELDSDAGARGTLPYFAPFPSLVNRSEP